MPGTDGRSSAQRSAATVITPETDLSSDEGLTTALSAFLAQLHSGFDEADAAVSPPVADLSARATVNVRPQRAANSPGGLSHRTPGATQQPTKAAFSPLHPMSAPGANPAARLPAVDAWNAAAVLAGQRDGSGKTSAPKTAGRTEKVAAATPQTAPGPKSPIVRKAAGPTKAATPERVTGKAHKLAELPSLVASAQLAATKFRSAAARERLIGAGVGVLLVTSLGFTLSWGVGESNSISQKSAQLAATRNKLSATTAELAQAQRRVNRQLRNLAALNGSDLHWKGQSAHLQAQLAQTQAQLTEAQQRVGTVQSQLDQAQGQLGTTQHSLLTLTQAHASQCQRAAVLAQDSVSVNNSVVITETQYLSALRAGNPSAMKQYLDSMNALQDQASGIGSQLSSTMNACLGGSNLYR